MADLEERFQAAADEAESLGSQLSKETQLKLYALYKVGMPSSETGPRPTPQDLEDIGKYEDWAEERAQTMEDAMEAFIELVDEQPRSYER